MNINRPMPYRLFKTLSLASQKDYLEGLRKEFHASDKKIAEMMGVAPQTLCSCFQAKGLPRGKGIRMSEEQISKWNAWVNGETTPTEETPTEEVSYTNCIIPEENDEIEESDDEIEEELPADPNEVTIVDGCMTVVGELDACLKRVMCAIGSSDRVRLSVSWEVV